MLEGMKFDADSDMGKIVLKLIDIVDDLAHDLTDAEERADVMADYIDELDHDLGEVESMSTETIAIAAMTTTAIAAATMMTMTISTSLSARTAAIRSISPRICSTAASSALTAIQRSTISR